MSKVLTIIASLFILTSCASTNTYVDEVLVFESTCPTMTPQERRLHNSVIPQVRYEHIAPRSAQRKGINGYVVMDFDIDENGNTTNINVIKSYPSDVYIDSSVLALSKWQYTPITKNGVPILSKCHSVKLEYRFKS